MKPTLENIVALHNNPKFVIDVGGYLGDYASLVYKKFASKILLFEPVLDYADICKNRFSNNPNIKVIRMALGGSKGETVIYKAKNTSSMFNGLAKSNESEVVSCGKLSDYMTDEIDLVKLNCEGGEYDILYDLIETGWLMNVPEVLVQFHKMKSHNDMFNDLQEQLSKTHELVFIPKWQLWKIKQ